MIKLFDYQLEILSKLLNSTKNDLVQLDTGAGKTHIEASLALNYENFILVAHRNTLIKQCSEKLALFKIKHNTISTEFTRSKCQEFHVIKHRGSFIDQENKTHFVASIDSLISWYELNKLHLDTSKKWVIVIDEAHHVVRENKWGKLLDIFKNARFIGFTATPARMDGESLHIEKGGIFHRLIQSDTLKKDSVSTLINLNRLSRFKVYSPKNFISYRNDDSLEIAGDVIEMYKKYALNKKAIVMFPAILTSNEYSKKFKQAGISSASISSHLSSTRIEKILKDFRENKFDVLCNVDMLGEGFDAPDVECLIIAKKTGSFIAYRQWIGRVLRVSQNKKEAIIIDHCGNVEVHGMPDDHVDWDIERPPVSTKKIRSIPCDKCNAWFSIKEKFCPDCGSLNILFSEAKSNAYYIELKKRLDIPLFEQSKKKYDEIDLEKKESEKIVYTLYEFGHGETINKAVSLLQKKLVSALIDEKISFKRINNFIKNQNDIVFWIKNFKVSDINLSNDKFLKEFLKWEKQQ